MKKLLLFLAAVASLAAFAQDGSLDPTFGDGGIVTTDLDNSSDLGWLVAEQADQKIVVAGNTTLNNNDSYPYLIRYMPDGSVDTSFGTDGKIFADYGVATYGHRYLFVDNQQKILTAAVTVQGSDFIVARYLENGNLDSDFGTNGILTISNGTPSGMAMLEDGSFLLLKFSGSNEITINHYLPNGDLDLSFGNNGNAVSTFSGEAFSRKGIKVDAEHNVYLLGTRDNNANSDIILMKFSPNGYLDTSFAEDGVATRNIDALNPMNFSRADFDFTSDNKIVIAGSCGACVDFYNPVFQPFFIRYNPDGSPDVNFGNNGAKLLTVSGTLFSTLHIQQNQRMVVSGNYPDCFEGSTYFVSRYFEGGYIDNSFNGTGWEFDNYATILQDDGKILTVGNTFWYNGMEDIVLVRHTNNPLSVPDFENHNIKVYPNPSDGIFTVNSDFNLNETPYQITDITGKVISKGKLTRDQTRIDISTAQSGVYFLITSNRVFRLLKN